MLEAPSNNRLPWPLEQKLERRTKGAMPLPWDLRLDKPINTPTP
jgi:hypothetical protein